jgi:catechol 2,3-dioxygenase-like lactoylglutathione lyase family enzyme
MLASATPIAFIQTRDRAAAEAFYADVLGLTRLPGDDFAAVFDLAGAVLRITHIPDWQAGPHPVLGWRVDDIVTTVTALTAKGVAFTIYDGMGQDALGIWTAPDGTAKVAFFADPDGNGLSLTQIG